MKIKTELIKGYVAEAICSQITDFEIDEESIANTRAICALKEIQEILVNDDKLSDFEMIEDIISIFDEYNLDFGTCHDF